MRKLHLTLLLFLFYFGSIAQNTKYYLSAAGSDANNGTSSTTSWKTLSKVNSYHFRAGDQILLEGGKTFSGKIQIGNDDIGTTTSPIIVGSYGLGKAIINAGTGLGFSAYNAAGLEIQNLVFVGSGVATNNSNGIQFYLDQTSSDLDHLVVKDVDVSGFGLSGVSVGVWGTDKGFNDVRIERSNIHDNGHAGIITYGNENEYSSTNFYVGYCKTYRNYGRVNYNSTNSGSGIALSGIDGATIEYCEAYENGKNNAYQDGGPIGIWVYNIKNCIIQYCESHHNYAGTNADGGGFDIDGGSQNSTIQYCYSHDNEGAGFALLEFGSSNQFINNVIRYNISENDGRKNSLGSLAFWAANSSNKLTNCDVYNNTFYVNDNAVVSGIPSAIFFLGNNMSGVKIRNNAFFISGAATMLNASNSFSTDEAIFQNNNYFSGASAPRYKFGGTSSYSLESWKSSAPGQEMVGTRSVGTDVNPDFVNPGAGATIHPAEGGRLVELTGYQLQPFSPLINAGQDLRQEGINIGVTDFFQSSLAQVEAVDIGAHEFSYTTLPIYFTNFTADYHNSALVTYWSFKTTELVSAFVVEGSSNGRTFTPLSKINVVAGLAVTEYTDKLTADFPTVQFCRIAGINYLGKVYYSKVIKLNKQLAFPRASVYPNPVMQTAKFRLSPSGNYQRIVVRNSEGKIVLQHKLAGNDQTVEIDMKAFKQGIYYAEVMDGFGDREVVKILKL